MLCKKKDNNDEQQKECDNQQNDETPKPLNSIPNTAMMINKKNEQLAKRETTKYKHQPHQTLATYIIKHTRIRPTYIHQAPSSPGMEYNKQSSDIHNKLYHTTWTIAERRKRWPDRMDNVTLYGVTKVR